MTIRTIAELKSIMPVGQPRQTSVADLHDLIDTVEDRTTQNILLKTENYTATLADNRRTILFNAAGTVTLTLPNTLPIGFQLVLAQLGSGAVIVAANGGAILSRDNYTRTAGQYAMAYMVCAANAGASPQILLTGDLTL